MSYKLLSNVYYEDKKEYERLYKERFNNSIHFNFKIHDNEIFYCITKEILDKCIAIYELDKKIGNIRNMLPNIALTQFTERCLIDEIVLTNGIEGVNSTRREIDGVLRELKNGSKNKQRFYGLVKKYSMLSNEEIPLYTCEDIRALYDELVLSEVIEDDPDNFPDGKIFRKDMAEVASPTQKIIHKGLYPESKIIDAMTEALKILNNNDESYLIRISIFHYLFGYIHPFYDGNGRTSRFISSYLLSSKLEELIGYRLSYTIKENISVYYEAFKICNDIKNKGDITPFIIMFLNIIEKSMERLHEALMKRQLLLDNCMKSVKGIKSLEENPDYEICFVLIQAALFSEEGINKAKLCNVLNVSHSTLDKRLKRIRERGFLKEKKIGHEKYYNFDLNKLS